METARVAHGRKTGYAGAILRVMGLRPRQRAERYLWAEADGDVAALLSAYTQPEKMQEIAAIIRSWIPCPYGPHAPDPSCSRCKGTGRWDARDLWEVLRREKRRGLWEAGHAINETALYAVIGSWCREVRADGGTSGFWGPDETKVDAEREGIARRFAALPWPPVLIAQDAAVDVGSVAGWIWLSSHAYRKGEIESGWQGADESKIDGYRNLTLRIAADLQSAEWPSVALTPDARLQPGTLPSGTVVYMDPPYANTTGYKASFSRDQVCETAERWATAGARVYISEAEPIAALGWHHVEITSERKGQARTFGATAEWLTCSHRPAWTPPRQSTLFTCPT